jgi:microcystin-dependent protein
MSRNQSGQYTLPLPPVSPGDVVEAQWANLSLGDIGEALTQSLDRNGRGPMLAPLILSSSNPTQSLEAVSKAYVESKLVYATGMPVASVCPFASLTAPVGWLKCDGAAVSRATYSVLFGIIGTTYGVGDGSTTFNLPNLVGEFIRGTPVGRDVGSKQAGSFASHVHAVQDPGHTHGASGSQASHWHGITTGGHSHSINDPGHRHNAVVGLNVSGSGIAGGSGVLIANQTEAAGTGISINGVGNLGGNTDAQQPTVSVSIAAATTGETIGASGGAETVPQNIAMDFYIKALPDASGINSIVSITSNDANMISINETNPAIPELVIHSNTPFGIPKLDANAKIPLAQLPQGASVLLGYFDASSGANPSQAHPATNYSNGEMYIVSVGGTILVRDPATGVESNVLVAVGGTLLYLEGQTQPDGWYYSIPVAADSAANISFLPEGTIAATNVQAAIAELDSETQAALAGKAPTSAGTAVGTSVTPTGTIAATNVQAALAELDGDIQALGVPPASGITFTPTGTIAATNVQAAVAEVADEAVQVSGDTMTGALAAPAFQTGTSGDPAKNFTLSIPAAPDGTMKLARGNAGATTQDIMTVDAAGKVDFKIGILGFEYGAAGDRFYIKLPAWFGARFLINWGSQAATVDVNGDVRFEYLVATVSSPVVICSSGDDTIGNVLIAYRPSGLLPLQGPSFRCRVADTGGVYAGSVRVNYISIGKY